MRHTYHRTHGRGREGTVVSYLYCAARALAIATPGVRRRPTSRTIGVDGAQRLGPCEGGIAPRRHSVLVRCDTAAHPYCYGHDRELQEVCLQMRWAQGDGEMRAFREPLGYCRIQHGG